MTELLYLEDTYLFNATSSINSIRTIPADSSESKWGTHVLELSKTIFHPQGGGQPSDKGKIVANDIEFNVEIVKSTPDNIVLHYCSTSEDVKIEDCTNTEVELTVDTAHRIECAALHSAGHLIDVAMNQLGLLGNETLVATKGYHFKDGPYVEYKGTTTENTSELPNKLNEILVQLVDQNISTEIAMVTKEEAGVICNCDTSSYPDLVRVVYVGGLPCPCGGTHVKTTKDLGTVTVTKVKKKGSAYKVSYSVAFSSDDLK